MAQPSWKRCDERFAEKTWIHRIALHVAISFHRRERRHRERRVPIDVHAIPIADVPGISVSDVGTKLLRIKDRLRVAFEQRARLAERSTSTRIARRNRMPLDDLNEPKDLQPWARRLVDAVSGRALRSTAGHLAELSKFEREEPPAAH